MASLKYILRLQKVRVNGEAPIYLRIIKDRKTRFMATGVFLNEKDWNPERQQVRKSHPLAVKLNDHLQTNLLQARGKVMQARNVGADSLKATIAGDEKRGDMLHHLQNYIDELKANDRYWQYKHYTVLLNKLRTFARGSLSFAEFDLKRLEAFELYLKKKHDNGPATIYKNLSRLKAFINHCIKQRLISIDENPFFGYKLKDEKGKRHRLTAEHIETLHNLPLSGWKEIARDAFILAYWGAGIRFGDVCRLTWDNVKGETLVYTMAKNGKEVEIPILPKAREILDKYADSGNKYIIPLLAENRDYTDPLYIRKMISSRNAYVNRLLIDIVKDAGIPVKISFHVARHSFADNARKMGLDVYTISQLLQHSTLFMTQKYLDSMDKKATDSGMMKFAGGLK